MSCFQRSIKVCNYRRTLLKFLNFIQNFRNKWFVPTNFRLKKFVKMHRDYRKTPLSARSARPIVRAKPFVTQGSVVDARANAPRLRTSQTATKLTRSCSCYTDSHPKSRWHTCTVSWKKFLDSFQYKN